MSVRLKPGWVKQGGKVIRKKDAKKPGPKTFPKGAPCKTCGNKDDRWKDGSCGPCRRRQAKERYAQMRLDPEAYQSFLHRQAADAAQRKEHELHLGMQTREEYKSAATPAWLTLEQIADIESLYYKARLLTRRSGVKYVVDHIVPLKHPQICGLHVPWNLKVITAKENAQKKNGQYWDPEMFE